MPRGRPKKIKNPEEDIKEQMEELGEEPIIEIQSEKEKLLELYDTLKELAINSIGDLENKIANCK